MNKNKRGQVTIFIILGIVIVVGIALYFYITTKVTNPELNVPRLTGDEGQVQTFVEGCIENVGRMGLIELGRHGGYIDPNDRIYSLMTFEYDLLNPSESDLVFLNKYDDTTGIPYWYYHKSEGDCWHCTAMTTAPSLSLMEYQLETYVDENILDCLENYTAFREQGLEVVSLTNTTTAVTIAEDSVGFLTTYRLQISKNGKTSYIEAFYKDIDVPLLKYYNAAIKITQKEIDTGYLDFYGLYLLGQYMGMDSKKFPPFSAYRVGYAPTVWSKTNIKKSYSSLLTSYIQFFRITGSENDIDYSITGKPLELQMYGAMHLSLFDAKEISELDIRNREINHIYAGQPIYMNIMPSNGDLIMPSVTSPGSGNIVSSMDPDQNYAFFYDISYPVIIEIKDSRPGKEYSFMFALQGNIKENKLLSEWLDGLGTISWSEDYVSMNTDIPVGTIEEGDVAEGVESYEFEPLQSAETLFCDNTQRLSGDIKVRAYDSYTDMPLEGATVNYHCGVHANCPIGVTEYNSLTNEAVFSGKLPICVNGYLQLDKEDYLSKRIPLTTEYERANNVGSVYMEQIFYKNITIKKYVLSRTENGYSFGSSVNLSENDTLIISLRKITLDNWDESWVQTVILGKDGSKDSSQLRLVPGMYALEAQLLDYNGIVIPKECQVIEVKGEDDILIPENDLSIQVAMWGGISFNDTNPLVITPENLINNNTLEIAIVRMPDPRCLNDMNEPLLTASLAKRYSSILMPKFV